MGIASLSLSSCGRVSTSFPSADCTFFPPSFGTNPSLPYFPRPIFGPSRLISPFRRLFPDLGVSHEETVCSLLTVVEFLFRCPLLRNFFPSSQISPSSFRGYRLLHWFIFFPTSSDVSALLPTSSCTLFPPPFSALLIRFPALALPACGF